MVTLVRGPTFQAPLVSLNKRPSKPVNTSFLVHYSDRKSSGTRILRSQSCSDKLFRTVIARKTLAFASSGEVAGTDSPTEEVPESEIQENTDDPVGAEESREEATVEDGNTDINEPSPVVSSLLAYKEALRNNEESKLAEVEAFLKSIEEEKYDLEEKLSALSEEMSREKVRVLKISADFDNFRKRTERERLSLVTNAQGEVIENLLPVLDNFERAKTQIKVESEEGEKISSSYQSIYKQFAEILGSMGVVPVDTVGNPFDPLLHEAIMQEDSAEFEEGIILEEYRKGFRIGDRLLRPAMVKVSAGPGPSRPETSESSSEESSSTGNANGSGEGSYGKADSDDQI